MPYLMSFICTFIAISPIFWPVAEQSSVAHAVALPVETGSGMDKLFVYSLEDLDYIQGEQFQCSIDQPTMPSPVPAASPTPAPTEPCRPAEHKPSDKIETLPPLPPPPVPAKNGLTNSLLSVLPLTPASVATKSCTGSQCPVEKSTNLSPIKKARTDFDDATDAYDAKNERLKSARAKLKTAQDDVTMLERETGEARTKYTTAQGILNDLVNPQATKEPTKAAPPTKEDSVAAMPVPATFKIIEMANKYQCPACEAMKPVMERLHAKGIVTETIYAEEDQEAVTKYRIKDVPTFILLRNATEVDRFTEAAPSEQKLADWYGKWKAKN